MFNFNSLKEQVLIEEKRALANRLRINKRITTTKTVLHDKITSPAAFVTAFASGGILAWLVSPKRTKSEDFSAKESSSNSESAAIVKNVKRLLITLAANKVSKFISTTKEPKVVVVKDDGSSSQPDVSVHS